ncbi:MAG: hypothetical protein J5722_10600 [Oscillospiraceae bacterium]|nr:hypothetical protein [Oscillospiraceae bacterium]
MKKRTLTAVLCAALCLTGCSAASAGNSQTETGQSAELTAAENTTAEESVPETEAPPVTEPEPERTVEVITEAVKANKADNDTKILFSERGLDAVRINDTEGYGEELKLGASYLDWKLESYDGTLADSAQSVVSMDADFSRESTLAVNGIITVLSKDDPDNPNAMYLRVDNQGDFPYFVTDFRERGRYIIENSRDVFAMLELADPPVEEQYEIAVSVSVTSLHIHMGQGQYDTIRVTAASKR